MFLTDWRLYAFGSAFFAALTAILGKIGVSEINSNLATLIRTMVVLAMAGLLVWARGEWQSPMQLSQKTLVFLGLSGLATGASWFCYYHALKMAPASKVAPIDKLSVALTIILAVVFLGEKLTLKTALGGILVAAGALVLAF